MLIITVDDDRMMLFTSALSGINIDKEPILLSSVVISELVESHFFPDGAVRTTPKVLGPRAGG